MKNWIFWYQREDFKWKNFFTIFNMIFLVNYKKIAETSFTVGTVVIFIIFIMIIIIIILIVFIIIIIIITFTIYCHRFNFLNSFYCYQLLLFILLVNAGYKFLNRNQFAKIEKNQGVFCTITYTYTCI